MIERGLYQLGYVQYLLHLSNKKDLDYLSGAVNISFYPNVMLMFELKHMVVIIIKFILYDNLVSEVEG